MDFDAIRKKKARERRMRQNKNRRRNSNMVRIPGVEVMQRIGKAAQARRTAPKIAAVTSLPRIRSVQPFHNVGKAAVRMDRRIRQERQRIQMKMRAAA